jgi:hypothetical protein
LALLVSELPKPVHSLRTCGGGKFDSARRLLIVYLAINRLS